jgi:peptidoglycan/LPS O-acetylase OafA/YrhL
MSESKAAPFLALRRITVSLAYRPELDGIRFLAISFVIVYHVAGDILRHSPDNYAALSTSWLLPLSLQLNLGVELFFVLSGFVLGLPFARHFLTGTSPVMLSSYYRRRLTRLEPPYILALLLLLALKVIWGHYHVIALLPHLAASVAYLHNLVFRRPSDIDFVAWSLEVEVQFYLLAPFLAALAFGILGKVPRRVALVTAILLCGIFDSLAPESLLVKLSLLGYLPYFLAGFLLAELDILEPEVKACYRFWDAVALAACLLVVVWSYSGPKMLLLAGPLTILIAYYAAFHSVGIKRLLSLPLVSTLGGMCYSIYLLHNYIIAGLGSFTEKLTVSLDFPERLVVQLLIMIGPILAISGSFFFFVERPCMQPNWPIMLKAWCAGLLSNRKNVGQVEAERLGDAG